MEKNHSTFEIEEAVDAIFLLSAYAHVRPLFKEVGLSIYEGLIILITDLSRKEGIIKAFEQCGCVNSRIYRNKIPSFPNYKLVMIENQSFYRADIIEEFLACAGYFPMLIICGVIPENVKGHKNIICLEHEIDNGIEYAEERGDLFKSFAAYSHENADDLVDVLKKFKGSGNFKKINEKPALYQALYGTSILYYYYRTSFVKNIEPSSHFFDRMESCIRRLCESSEIYDRDTGISSTITNLLLKYFDTRNDFLFGKLDRVEGKLLSAVRKERAILYDEDFYYAPEKLLREATKSLQPILSYTAIKRELYQDGVLVCNDVLHSYTVKKILVNAYGEVMRFRFLKLKRSRIDSEDGLSILERSVKICT